jgi:LPS O-antigen subunit length determinant protein (WzzB/FepE family)
LIDHDRLFKELLTTFFTEFLELFLPDVVAFIEPNTLEAMDKEIFTDVTAGEKHLVDILMKAQFKGQEKYFLLHVELQSSADSEFNKRMSRYFARLDEKYDKDIYPIVLLSYDKPRNKAESSRNLLNRLPEEKIDPYLKAFFTFKSLEDVAKWLKQ